MSERRWKPAAFRGGEVWIAVDDEGRAVTDARGLVEFRYQPGGKSYHTHADRLSPRDGEVVGGASSEAPAKPSRPAPSVVAARAPSPCRSPTPAQLPPGTVEVWTDGACSGNPGPAGLGVHVRDGARVIELSEFLGEGTNNIAELMAILRGLEVVGDRKAPIAVMTDSEYSLGLLTKGWKPKKNQELVAELRALAAQFERLMFIKVAGHAGIAGNERADVLARRAIETRSTTRTSQG